MRTVATLAGLLLIAAPVAAGQATPDKVELARALTLRGVVFAGVADPSLRNGVGSPKPEIILVVQNDGTTAAKARIGVIRGDVMADVTLTGPVLVKGATGTLFTNEGVGANTSVRIRAQYVKWSLKDTTLADLIPGVAGQPSREAVRDAEKAVEGRLRAGVATSLPIFVSGSYEFGSQAFTFIDPATLVDQKTTESPWAANVSFGVLAGNSGNRSAESPGTFFGGSVEFFQRFKATPEREICRPIGAGGFECDKFRVGPPTTKTGQSVQFESRLWLNSAEVGLNPRATYDVQDKYWDVEVPVYFLKLVADADKDIFSRIPDLAAGVTVGWRSDQERGWYAVVFIGPTFKLPSPPAK